MPIKLQTKSSDEFIGMLKYNATDAKLVRVDRDFASGDKVLTDITEFARMVIDIPGLQHGFVSLIADRPPQKVLTPYSQPLPPTPAWDPLTEIFEAKALLVGECAAFEGDLRTWDVSSKAGVAGLSALVDDFNAQSAGHPGLLPVVTLGEPVTRRGAGGSTNFAPNFQIVDWTEPPEGLIGAVPFNDGIPF